MWLTHKRHATGTLKNYAFPFCRAHTVTPDEVARLPFNYLLLSHGGGAADAMHTNVVVTPRLEAALAAMKALATQEAHTFATDAAAAPALLAALEEAKAAFDAAPRHEAVAEVAATPPTAEVVETEEEAAAEEGAMAGKAALVEETKTISEPSSDGDEAEAEAADEPPPPREPVAAPLEAH